MERNRLPNRHRRSEFSLILLGCVPAAFYGRIQRLTGWIESGLWQHGVTLIRGWIDDYSAAAASEGLALAADTMKSEMRGTISDLKREPLKTP